MLLFFGASYDLFASARKTVVVSVRSNLPQTVQQFFLNQLEPPPPHPAPNKKFLDPPLLVTKEI